MAGTYIKAVDEVTTGAYDTIAIILANRCYQYHFLQRVFGNEPSHELLTAAASEHTKESLQLALDETDCRFDDYFTLLIDMEQKLRTDPSNTLEKLKDEYTRLFIGPNSLPAPPWESVYTSKERTLFQASTLEVRRIYSSHHFLPVNYPNEPDDHLAIQLDFMLNLANMTQDLFAGEDNEAVRRLLVSQKEFLEQHLLNWVGCFAADIQGSKTRYFYPQTAVLTNQLLVMDGEILNELISIL
jgi:TorA maturation chaperone TorD